MTHYSHKLPKETLTTWNYDTKKEKNNRSMFSWVANLKVKQTLENIHVERRQGEKEKCTHAREKIGQTVQK